MKGIKTTEQVLTLTDRCVFFAFFFGLLFSVWGLTVAPDFNGLFLLVLFVYLAYLLGLVMFLYLQLMRSKEL